MQRESRVCFSLPLAACLYSSRNESYPILRLQTCHCRGIGRSCQAGVLVRWLLQKDYCEIESERHRSSLSCLRHFLGELCSACDFDTLPRTLWSSSKIFCFLHLIHRLSDSSLRAALSSDLSSQASYSWAILHHLSHLIHLHRCRHLRPQSTSSLSLLHFCHSCSFVSTATFVSSFYICSDPF